MSTTGNFDRPINTYKGCDDERGCGCVSYATIHTDHLACYRVNMLNVFGGIDAQRNQGKATAAELTREEAKNADKEPGEQAGLVTQHGNVLVTEKQGEN